MLLKKTFIIAEAGVNHNGSLSLAKKLVIAAKSAGANAIKFQTFKAEDIISKKAKKISYQKKNRLDKENQYHLLKRLELSEKNFIELYSFCKKKKIEFISTAKDLNSAKFLNSLKIKRFKIGSGDLLNKELLNYIGKTKKEIIVSTGLANIKEISNVFKYLGRKKKVYLLHCISLYPTPDYLANLNTINYLKEKFKVPCGFSDHTLGYLISLAAIAKGARIIEKHFTLSKKMLGPDHKLSLEPHEFKQMVKGIRQIEKSFGKCGKFISNKEKANIKKFRRGLYFNKKLTKNSIICAQDISIKRPLLGLSPIHKSFVIGKKLKKNVVEDQAIKKNLIK